MTITEKTTTIITKEITPKDVATFLEECSDEEFAEVFVTWMKIREGDDSHLTNEDMQNFNLPKCVGLVHDCLDEIIFENNDMDVWWR